jgi:hypothetical protein
MEPLSDTESRTSEPPTFNTSLTSEPAVPSESLKQTNITPAFGLRNAPWRPATYTFNEVEEEKNEADEDDDDTYDTATDTSDEPYYDMCAHNDNYELKGDRWEEYEENSDHESDPPPHLNTADIPPVTHQVVHLDNARLYTKHQQLH